MGMLLACMISRADLLGEALLEERQILDTSLPKAADGWGAGFYQAGEALHRKLPQPIDGQIDGGACSTECARTWCSRTFARRPWAIDAPTTHSRSACVSGCSLMSARSLASRHCANG